MQQQRRWQARATGGLRPSTVGAHAASRAQLLPPPASRAAAQARERHAAPRLAAASRSAQYCRLLSGRADRPITSIAVAAPKVKYLRAGRGEQHRGRGSASSERERRRAAPGARTRQQHRRRNPWHRADRRVLGRGAGRGGAGSRPPPRPAPAAARSPNPDAPGPLPRLPLAGVGRGGLAKEVAAGLVLALREEGAAAARAAGAAAAARHQGQAAQQGRHRCRLGGGVGGRL